MAIRFIIKESVLLYLLEDKASDIREKYYSDIPEDRYKTILLLDPTTVQKNNGDIVKLGTYSKWLLNLHKEGELKDNGEDDYKVKQYLELFDKVKTQLDVSERNIFNYKNLPSLYAAISHFEEKAEEDEESIMSNSAIVKRIKTEETKKFYEDSNWLVVIPKTERASCLWGKNTQWCTAAEKSNNMFNNYNSQGPLYIIIDKKNNTKHQLHFQSGSIADEEDYPIEPIDFFDEMDNSLYKIFFPLLLRKAQEYVVDYCLDDEELYFTDNGYLVYTIDSKRAFKDFIYNDFTNLIEPYESLTKEIDETEYRVDNRFVEDNVLNVIKKIYSKDKDLSNIKSVNELSSVLSDFQFSYLENLISKVFQKVAKKYAKKVVKDKFLNFVPTILNLRPVISDEKNKNKNVFMSNDGFDFLINTAFNKSMVDIYDDLSMLSSDEIFCLNDLPIPENFYRVPTLKDIVDEGFIKLFNFTLYRILLKRSKENTLF